jgi:hypothetical protein
MSADGHRAAHDLCMTLTPDSGPPRAPTDNLAPGTLRALSRWLLWPVAGLVVIVIFTSFLLSFQSQVELAEAARIPEAVSFGWPIIVDGTVVISSLALLTLHPHGKRASWFPAMTLILFGAVSIWANGLHAIEAGLGPVALFFVGSVPALGLLASTHMLTILISHGRKVMPAVTVKPVAVRPTAPQITEPVTFEYSRVAEQPQTAVLPETTVSKPNLKPQTSTTPKRVVEKKLTRDEAVAQIIEIEGGGGSVTGADVGQWMGLSPNRGARILDQIHADTTHEQEAAV